MKKVIKYILILLSIVLFKLLVFTTINEIIILNYNNNVFDKTLVKTLYFLNINESYIAYYNDGNILYNTGKYKEAIEKYEESLEKHPPEKRVCDVIINKSLAMIKIIDKTFDKKQTFDQLDAAKNNLYRFDCASDIDDSGKSEDAEKLEEEIKKLLEEQKSSPKPKPDPEEPEKPQEQPQDPDGVEEELKKTNKKAGNSRSERADSSENIGDYSYYSGKKW